MHRTVPAKPPEVVQIFQNLILYNRKKRHFSMNISNLVTLRYLLQLIFNLNRVKIKDHQSAAVKSCSKNLAYILTSVPYTDWIRI